MDLLIGSNRWTYSSIFRILRVMTYSTETLRRPNTSTSKPTDTLHTRVSRSGDPKSSVVPVLNKWLEEGKPKKQSTLQVSEYMSEEMKYNTSVGDMAVRLDFSKVHGMDQAEKYFNSLPEAMRTFQVHGALLNCYGNHKCLEKAGDTFRIMRESKLPNFAVSYNLDDLDGAEKVLAEWEIGCSFCDARIPSGWKPNTGTLAACLKYLGRENNFEVAKELLELLDAKGHLSIDVYDRLARSIVDRNVDVGCLDRIGNSETSDDESTI
ncbi:hypothetical protein F3Y22_tig00110156pilonHSYRG00561 [Hibiscus syriacus]|uniref:Pentatricopeptide repeat-containing protein n=1 Tax=Hibiscus syriacus TaxID=106335 RepID=A0A6A3BIW7_HIBSY|nr:hypothetical protein F3Y22_tig00110156pilonHSYRG00561 [Hibiscus syriacus]